MIQTYHPEHYSIRAAAVQDYESFYQEEMGFRRLLSYPPAGYMMMILSSCEDEEQLERGMYFLKKFLQDRYPSQKLAVIGPAAAPVGRINDVYHQVMYLKHASHDALVRIREVLEKYIEINSGFRNIFIQFDLNM